MYSLGPHWKPLGDPTRSVSDKYGLFSRQNMSETVPGQNFTAAADEDGAGQDASDKFISMYLKQRGKYMSTSV